MRYFLIFVIVTMFIVTTALLLFSVLNDSQPRTTIGKIAPSQKQPIKFSTIIEEINRRNAQIRNFSCDRMKIKVWQNGMRFRLNGTLHYEKTKRFRMIIRSIFGKEIDLGSNDEIFWYWSRRDKEKSLLYAKHEDYNKTRLKTPFNPIFMKESLGLNQIRDGKISSFGNFIIIDSEFENSIGKTVIRSTFLDKKNKRILGFAVQDKEEIIAFAEILAYTRDNLPEKILYVWKKEDKILLLNIQNPEINTDIDTQFWELPDLNPKIDMGRRSSAKRPNNSSSTKFFDSPTTFIHPLIFFQRNSIVHTQST